MTNKWAGRGRAASGACVQGPLRGMVTHKQADCVCSESQSWACTLLVCEGAEHGTVALLVVQVHGLG